LIGKWVSTLIIYPALTVIIAWVVSKLNFQFVEVLNMNNSMETKARHGARA